MQFVLAIKRIRISWAEILCHECVDYEVLTTKIATTMEINESSCEEENTKKKTKTKRIAKPTTQMIDVIADKSNPDVYMS